MAELSKTARASMGKQVKEVHAETTEEAIRQIRLNRAGGLFIGDMFRIDKLIKAYDEALLKIQQLGNDGNALIQAVPEFVGQGIRMAEVDNSEHFDPGGES